MAILECVNLQKKFGKGKNSKVILRDISFQLTQGSTTLLVGVNGIGKTTLFKMLVGLVKPTGGTFRYTFGSKWNEIFTQVSFLPETSKLPSELKGREFLDLITALKTIKTKQSFLDDFIKRFHMESFLQEKIKTYSKGMRQKLALLVSLLGEPRLLLWDEPYSGLDFESHLELNSFLSELQGNVTMLLSTHSLGEMQELSAEVLALETGVISFNGSWHDYLAHKSIKA